ncbi:MAG TPA: glycosyltransferase family 4 protein, partial [Thermoanaerobaculia bacterium]
MRILVAAQEAPPLLGGPSTWLLDLLQALRPLHQVGLLVPHGRDLAVFERAGVAPVFLAPSLTSDDPREAARIAAEIASFTRRQEVDLVHLAGAPLAHLAPALAEAGIPSVLTLLGGGDSPRGVSTVGDAPMRVTAVSRTAAAGVTDLVIPPGGDLDRFQPGDRAEARRALDLPLGRPVLLMIGRLLVSKGALEALEALRDLADLDPLLVVAGDGPDARRIDARVRFLGLEDRVRRTGAVAAEEIPRLYQAADLVLLPARDEAAAGLGLAAIEAAACALPMVASSEGALAEVVEDGRTGLLVPARDARALAAAVRALLADPARASALGREARRRAEEAFGRDLAAERYAEVYREAASGAPLSPHPPAPSPGTG